MPIFVLIFWLSVTDGKVTIEDIDLAAIVKTPTACESVDAVEAATHLKDAADHMGKGFIPKVVCGIAIPAKKAADATPPPPDVESSPGDPHQHGPSGEL